jgi:hypothetical protein
MIRYTPGTRYVRRFGFDRSIEIGTIRQSATVRPRFLIFQVICICFCLWSLWTGSGFPGSSCCNSRTSAGICSCASETSGRTVRYHKRTHPAEQMQTISSVLLEAEGLAISVGLGRQCGFRGGAGLFCSAEAVQAPGVRLQTLVYECTRHINLCKLCIHPFTRLVYSSICAGNQDLRSYMNNICTILFVRAYGIFTVTK